ncbi:hypothetical protein [Methylobacterium cerastii]|uniref:hypothetical protein n=1 Tax=Methylobacterium cerastii TaxID=932741 RepID=UPI001EE1F50A|nr:hypothetical protein [Methylobacterium cerastii]
MGFLKSLKDFFGRSQSRNSSTHNRRILETDLGESGDFSSNFNKAMMVLNQRINSRFPDNYEAGSNANRDYSRDYGDDRAAAIDTASAAVAAALRKGAGVREAAEAGAASIGI